MSQGTYVTLVGFVAQDPRLRQTRSGKNVIALRVGSTPRIYDRDTGEWRDKETSYYTVNCWQRLADHVRASLRKGDPVIVKGRFKMRSWEDRTGHTRTQVEIEADTVGHDLNRGVANYLGRQPAVGGAERDALRNGNRQALESGENQNALESEEARLLEAAINGSPDDVFDADAIDRFSRDLDEADEDDDQDDDEYETAARDTETGDTETPGAENYETEAMDTESMTTTVPSF